MKRIDLKTGFLCNNNCLFCVQGKVKKKYGNKTTEEMKKNLKESSSNFDGVVFTGGEVTIRNDIIELVSYAKKLGYATIQIQSNGRMFAYREFCEKMIAAGANEFALALHGSTPKMHDWLTGQSGSFRQTVQGIINLKSAGQTVLTNTVIVKSNYRHLPEIAKLLLSLNVDNFQFAFVHAIGDARDNFDQIVPRKTLVQPYLREALTLGRKFQAQAMAEGMPFCFLTELEDCISENIMPFTKVIDLDYTENDYAKVRRREGKSKGPDCRNCIYDSSCEGPWKEYPNKFGWEEFKPVKK